MSTPLVYIHPSCGAETAKLQEAVRRRAAAAVAAAAALRCVLGGLCPVGAREPLPAGLPAPAPAQHQCSSCPLLPPHTSSPRSLKAELAQGEGAGVTHVVRAFGEAGDPDDGQPYARTLEVKGAQAKVHWLYLPDSYNEWVPADAAPPPDAAPPARRRGPFHVYLRWLTDSEK